MFERWMRLVREADGGAGGADTTTTTTATSEAPAPPSYLYALGSDERPDFVPETFWNAEAGGVRVDELGKAYSQLQARFSQKNDALKAEALAEARKDAPEKPDDYVIAVDKSLVPPGYEVGDFDPASPLMAEARGVLHRLGATQADMDTLVKAYIGETFAKLPNLEAERAALGENAEERLTDVQRKLAAMVTAEDERGALLQMTATASGVKALETLLSRLGQSGVTGLPGGGAPAVMTPAEMSAAIGDPNYNNAVLGRELRERVAAARAAGVRPAGYTPRF